MTFGSARVLPLATAIVSATLLFASAAAPSAAAPLRFGQRAAPPASTVNFLVNMPLRNEAALRQLVALQSDPRSLIYRHFLTPAQFNATYGPTPATVSKMVTTLRAHGLSVLSAGTQILEVRGTAASVQRSFGIRLGMQTDARGARFGSYDAVHLPADLAAQGAHVIGLAAIPRARPQSHIMPQNRYFSDGPYWFTDLKQAYSFPSSLKVNGDVSGKRYTVVTVGDSDFSTSDTQAYFAHEGLGPGLRAPAPGLKKLLFNPYTAFNANAGISVEANLDVQQAGGAATGAEIIGAAAPNNVNEEFLVVYQYLVDHAIGDIISTSYGECELFYTAAYAGSDQTSILQDYNKVFVQGNAIGQTFVISSGDNSGLPCEAPGYFSAPNQGKTYNDGPGVSANADDPNVTAVGGTNLMTSLPSSSLVSNYIGESEFYDFEGSDDPYGTGNFIGNEIWGSGSGISNIFRRPTWQNGFSAGAGRSTPDVSMNMGSCLSSNWTCNNPEAGSTDVEVIGGNLEQVGGTSASAPEFAGLLALWTAVRHSDLGNINPTLYTMAQANATKHYFHDDIPGSNGLVDVPSGNTLYSHVTGLGSPIGVNFLGVPTDPVAGNPLSSTNP